MEEFIVKKTIKLKALPSKVWDALTNPEQTKKYFFNCRVLSNWKVGDPIVFSGRMFLVKKIEMKGKILRIEPGKILQYNLKNGTNSSDTGFSVVTDELYAVSEGTVLTITDNVGDGEGARERYERSDKGWDRILDGLKELVEEGAK